MAQVLYGAGVPDDVLAFLPGVGEEVGPVLVEHPLVASISFTGSKAVGLDIIERAAVVRPGQRHVKRVVAEMGGKNPIVVDTDADLDEAVPGHRALRLLLRRPEVLGGVAPHRACGRCSRSSSSGWPAPSSWS